QLGVDIDGEAAADLSGWKVSLSSDGTTVAIGAYANDGNGLYSGHVRVYKLVTFYNVWQGGQSTNWGTANNWSFGSEPFRCDDIKIPADLTNYPTISVNEDKVVYSITLDSGGSLILSENSSLSITDSFTNNGTVTLNSDSEKFSSLLVGGTTSGSGNVTYNRYVNIVGTGEWDLIGPPVSGIAFSSLIDDPNIANNGNSVYAVGSYNNLTDTWTNATAATSATMGNLTLGQGYQMATTGGGTLSFIGAIANGDQSVIITNNDAANSGAGTHWNLIANPFASYLNANSNADASNNFLTVNAASLETFYQAIYGWKADGTGYAIYNNTSTATYIAPGQGFFVAAAGSGEDKTITFTKAMQTVTGVDDFVAEKSSASYELVLDMHSDAVKVADTKFYFKEGLTLGLDPGYDAGAYNQSSGFSSRLLEQDSGIGMSINAMSIDDMSNVIVPLAVNQEAGISLKIQIANSTIPEDINVYLEDAVENKFTLLTNESFELLAQTTLSGVGRFFLHFTTRTLSTDTVSSTSLLTVYKLRGSAYISVEGLQQFSQPAALTLYNVLGMKILSRNIQNPSHKEMLSTVGMRTGVYILKVQAENIVFTKKLVIE
ncbi:T9SS type A sorting domain-containing protein, partial [Polaribacter sp.]|nr:T9SS type A sorting domain-containing protein [Polaribacter sp.]